MRWLWTPDRIVRFENRPWTYYCLLVLHSTQVYDQVRANLLVGVTLRWSRFPCSLHAEKTGDNPRVWASRIEHTLTEAYCSLFLISAWCSSVVANIILRFPSVRRYLIVLIVCPASYEPHFSNVEKRNWSEQDQNVTWFTIITFCTFDNLETKNN